MHLVLNFALNFFSSKHILIYILFSVPRLARYWRRREQALWEKGKRRLNLQRWVHLPFDIFAKIGSQFIMHFWMCVQLLRSEWFSETASISEFWRPATARHILDLLSEWHSFGNIWVWTLLKSYTWPNKQVRACLVHEIIPDQPMGKDKIDSSDVQERPLIAHKSYGSVRYCFCTRKHLSGTWDDLFIFLLLSPGSMPDRPIRMIFVECEWICIVKLRAIALLSSLRDNASPRLSSSAAAKVSGSSPWRLARWQVTCLLRVGSWNN